MRAVWTGPALTAEALVGSAGTNVAVASAGAVVGTRQVLARRAGPGGVACTGPVVAGPVSRAVVDAASGATVVPREAWVADADTVVAHPVARTRVRAVAGGAVGAVEANLALAGSVLALTIARALVGALLSTAFSTSPSVVTETGSVNAFSISVTIITGTHTDGAVGTDPAVRAVAFSLETLTSERAVVGAQFIHGHNRTIFSRVARMTETCTTVARTMTTAVIWTHPRGNSAVSSREAVFASTDTVDTDTVVGTHVLADACVQVCTAVSTREPNSTPAYSVDTVAMSIVTAIIRTHFHFTS